MSVIKCITEFLMLFKVLIWVVCISTSMFGRNKFQIEACNNFFDYCDSISNNESSHNDVQKNSSNILSMVLESNRYLNSTSENGLKGRQKRSNDAFETSNKITSMLDELLNDSGYDKQLRPGLSGVPIEVELNIAIRSMGPVDENSQTFKLDCYFRQFWVDFRLRFNSTALNELPMNWQFLTRIWRPDTIIINGVKSYLHKITVPNRFIRISPEGRISYSQRLTLKAKCKMNLRKFPLDKQICLLQIGSFGYSAADIKYRFSKKPLSWENKEKLGLSQHYMVDLTFGEHVGMSRQTGKYLNMSTLFYEFTFQRRTGFFILQIYIPLTLLVCCSWVQFWLTKTEKGGEIAARTSLGATTVLTVVTIGFEGKSKPQVGYATAHDVFVLICFFTVFAAMVEFACLNFLDAVLRKIKRQEEDRQLYEETLKKQIRGLRSCVFPGIDMPGRRTETIDDEDEDIYEYLEEKLLSPKALCDLDLPLLGPSVPNEKFVMSKIPNERLAIVQSTIPGKDDDNDEWQTIETTVVYDSGVKESFLEPDFDCLEELQNQNDPSFTEKFWECIVNTFLKLCCCTSSIEPNELTKYLSFVLDNVDHVSSRMFPSVFLLINVIYWTTYVYII